MSATREHRNAAKVDDAFVAIGAAITTAEHLLEALSGNLPDASEGDRSDYEHLAMAYLANLRQTYDMAREELGL